MGSYICVIGVSETVRLSVSQVERMYEANPSGAGVAWRDEAKDDKGKLVKVVRWKKGLTLPEIQDLCKELPLPFVTHFRIPTVGGPKKALCHPFPIERNVSLDLEGMIKGSVLFHNGHWGRWKDYSFDTSIKHNLKVPTGKWSDSRAMAWAAANHGIGILEFIGEKAIAFGPNEIEVFGDGHGAWTLIDGGIYVSNTGWQSSFRHNSNWAGICMYGQCKAERINGTKYCALHPDNKEKEVKALPEKKETGQSASDDNGSGGNRTQTPFREVAGGGQTIPSGTTEQEQVEASKARVGSVGQEYLREGQQRTPAVGETLMSEEEQEAYRWSCAINVKQINRRLVDPRIELVH